MSATVGLYFVNVALHAAILSVFASLVVALVRRPGLRSAAAVSGLLAVAVLPWLSASPRQPSKISAVRAEAMPTWTIATVAADVSINKATAPVVHSIGPSRSTAPGPLAAFAAIWAAGAVVGTVLLGAAFLKVSRWRRNLRALEDGEWEALGPLIPAGIGRGMFMITASPVSPCVIGFLKPRIVLPASLFGGAPPDGKRWAARHEIAHWRAGDSRWMILFAILRCVHWWNPLVHRLVGKWADAREELCDLATADSSRERANYGRFLLAMASDCRLRPPLVVAMAKRPHVQRLRRRIISLLDADLRAGKPAGFAFISMTSALLIGCASSASPMRIAGSKDAGAMAGAALGITEPLPVIGNQNPERIGDAILVNVIHRFVRTSGPSKRAHGEILSEREVRAYLRGISGARGATLVTGPSFTMKPGHPGIVEISRVHPGEPNTTPEERLGGTAQFAGVIGRYKVTAEGDAVRLYQKFHCRVAPGSDHLFGGGRRSWDLPWDKLISARAENIASLRSGQTVCSDFGEIEPGVHLQVFTTITSVDPAGSPRGSY